MSRVNIRTFLSGAKKHLATQLKNKGTASFVLGNESADLDSITCALVYSYLQSSSQLRHQTTKPMIPITNIPASDLPLRPELTALLSKAGLKPSDLITLDDLGTLPMPLEKADWTLVDHNALTGPLAKHYKDVITGCIDHHDDEHAVSAKGTPRIIEKSGSCSSLVTKYLHPAWEDLSNRSTAIGAANGQSSDGVLDDAAYTRTWDAQVAFLALGSILIDTYNLTDKNKVTSHDEQAVKYLEAKINISKYGKDYERKKFFDEINAAKADLEGLSVKDVLRKDYKMWEENGLKLGMSSVVKPLEWLKSKSADPKSEETTEDEDFRTALASFAKERELSLFAIMTAFTKHDAKFARELLVLTTEDGEDVAEKFVSSWDDELQLEAARDLDLDKETANEAPWVRIWTQGNVGASRKQVGPMLREAMR